MNWARRTSSAILAVSDAAAHVVAVSVAVLYVALWPSHWTRTVRQVWARQMLFTGVDGIGMTLRVGFALGLLVIVQVELWLGQVGDVDFSGRLFLSIFLRELGPFLANLIVIIRSGTAIATEIGRMRVDGDIEVLETQGIDPMSYLIMPRVLSVAFAVFGLAVILVATAFISGYVVGMLMGVFTAGPYDFLLGILRQVQPEDVMFFVPKTMLTGLLIGTIACTTGLEIRDREVEIPQLAGRGAMRSLMVVFFVSMLLSLSIAGKVLIFQVL